MTIYDEDDHKVLECLQKAVHEALDRKRRLGQYAVVWKDGKPTYIGPNAPMKQVGALAEPKSMAPKSRHY